MAIDPPYRLDPFRNIINVHWNIGEETSAGTGNIAIHQYVRASLSGSLNYGTWGLGQTYIENGPEGINQNWNITNEHPAGYSNTIYWGFPNPNQTWPNQGPPYNWEGSFGLESTLTIYDGSESHTCVADFSGCTLTADFGPPYGERTWAATGTCHEWGPTATGNTVAIGGHIIFTLQE